MWFVFWVIVCGLGGFAILFFAGLRVIVEPDMPWFIRWLFLVVVLAVAVLVGSLPWLIHDQDEWEARCRDAGGVVVVTDTYPVVVMAGKVPVVTQHNDYGCLRNGQMINV